MDENELEPVVGNWYTHVDDGQTFVVLAIDEDKGIIEIQHEDGDVEELELGEWSDMDLEPAEPPEDWEGLTDDVEAEDDVSFTEPETAGWRAPVGGARRRAAAKEEWDEPDDDEEDDEDDDWDDGDDDYDRDD